MLYVKNASVDTLFYIVSTDSILSNLEEIENVRPSPGPFVPVAYRLFPGDSSAVLHSRSIEMFANAETIPRVLEDHYNGKAFIYFIKEADLMNATNQEIVNKKLFRLFTVIQPDDITSDITTITYP